METNKKRKNKLSDCCQGNITDNGICAACGKWAITYDTRFKLPSYRRFFDGIESHTGKKIKVKRRKI